MKFLVSPLPSYCSLGGSRSSKPPLAQVPGIRGLDTPHSSPPPASFLELVGLKEVGLTGPTW